ncbi:MAG: dUTP diphosphatase [Clostridiaceae bacterium]
MKLETLFEIQRVLNNRIVEEHGLDVNELRNKKFLSLLTELGELANETRCFKYWSNKGPSPKEVILEEYVDCLHFILTIGLDHGFEKVKPAFDEGENKDITQQFINLFLDVNELIIYPSLESYQDMLEEFFRLGILLDFTKKEIYDAYLEKNKINHVRQDEKY